MSETNKDTLRRFRLMLGAEEADGTGLKLEGQDKEIDNCLGALYEFERKKSFDYKAQKGKGGQESSNPGIARWLGDIRKYFPQSVVQVIQNDALQQPELKRKLMFEPEILEEAVPDVHLVATLLELGKLIPSKTKDTARRVVQKVVDALKQKLEQRTIQAINGAINRSARNNRPRFREIDWNQTIRKNLKHYQPDLQTVILQQLVGFGRKNRRALKEVVICLDQSGSMGTSVVYSGIFGSVMASLPALKTSMIAFDTAVTDLSEDLKDPVDLLFGVQLGGGTDINKALTYCQQRISRPADTIFLLISDLFEGGDEQNMRSRVSEMHQAGIQFIVLLALNDEGSPSYDRSNAQFFASLQIPVFACTPDRFPDVMAAALSGGTIPVMDGD